MKNIRVFLSKNFQFLEVKFSIYLNRRVFVMMTSQGQMETYSYPKAKRNLNIPLNYLQYQSVCQAIEEWKKKTSNKESRKTLFWLSVYMKNRKGIQDIYKILNDNTDTAAGKLTWNKTFNFSEIDWKNIYSWPFKITSNTSLQWFQTCVDHIFYLQTNFFIKSK